MRTPVVVVVVVGLADLVAGSDASAAAASAVWVPMPFLPFRTNGEISPRECGDELMDRAEVDPMPGVVCGRALIPEVEAAVELARWWTGEVSAIDAWPKDGACDEWMPCPPECVRASECEWNGDGKAVDGKARAGAMNGAVFAPLLLLALVASVAALAWAAHVHVHGLLAAMASFLVLSVFLLQLVQCVASRRRPRSI